MKRSEAVGPRTGKSTIVAALGAILMLTTLSTQAWEVGLINTWIHNDASHGGGGTAHGASLMLREEVWRYADVGARAGYMRSDCFKTYYVPLELTGALKYPLFDGRLVPYVGVIGEYRVFARSKLDLENAFGVSPNCGFDWRFGKEKRWSVFVELRYQFLRANLTSGGHGPFDGPGGSGGINFRF